MAPEANGRDRERASDTQCAMALGRELGMTAPATAATADRVLVIRVERCRRRCRRLLSRSAAVAHWRKSSSSAHASSGMCGEVCEHERIRTLLKSRQRAFRSVNTIVSGTGNDVVGVGGTSSPHACRRRVVWHARERIHGTIVLNGRDLAS